MSALPSKWNVPYRRNVFFTGREDILARLYDTLAANKTAALTQPQAISGLGGIGKTQTALEYVYRYGNEYNAVLWAKADSRAVLVSAFVSIADLFHLPEKSEQDQNRVVNAVKRWLQTNKNWLLILDNVEDLTMVSDFIPPASNGHILLTTRAQATGTIANNIEIEKMEPEEGALVLLHRAKLIETASEEDLIKAKEISQEMDGLPLALDQAGAFIEETGCSLLEYLELYQAERAFLLKDRGESDSDHPESVTVTFLLSFENIARANPVADAVIQMQKCFRYIV